LLGASAILTDRGITVFRARCPKLFQTWDWTFRESAVLPSNIVSTTRKSNEARSLDLTRSMTLMSVGRPSMGKNSHWTGIRTRSEVTSALRVSSPMFGGQSIMIVLNWSLIGASASRGCILVLAYLTVRLLRWPGLGCLGEGTSSGIS